MSEGFINLAIPSVEVATAPADEGVDAKVHDVVVVGSGPAGWTAAVYTARADSSRSSSPEHLRLAVRS